MRMNRIDSTEGDFFNCVDLSDGVSYSVNANERVTKIEKAVLTLG